MKREPPRHVVAALRSQVCPEIGLEWDEESCCWHFTYEGRRQSCVLTHPDGELMLSLDGYTDAIVALAQQSDAYQDFGERRKAMRRSVEQARQNGRNARRHVLADLRSPAKDRARFERFGPRVFSFGQ